MRLKEIKPGMVIHCKTQEEANILCEHLREKQVWKTFWRNYKSDTCYQMSTVENLHIHPFLCYGDIDSFDGMDITEFSDIIMPELTAEEALRIRNELSFEFVREYLGLGYGRPLDEMLRKATVEQIIDMCQQWKSDHKKKESEIETEWFWQGRIYKVEDNGNFYQIKDGTGFYDTGCEYRESAEEYMEDALKEYCKTHDGDYVAVVERVCRVKAVE